MGQQMMKRGILTGWAGAVLAGAVVAAAGPALGQMQVQSQGAALDANPQVGSGGSNTPVRGYVPLNGNDIITGNVNGLAYFHGPVGTSSPYVFQGTLGTSSLQNFSRQSAGAIPTAPGQGLNSVYYLPSATVTSAQGSAYSSGSRSGYDSRIVPLSPVAAATSAGGGNLPEPVAAGLPVRSYLGSPGGTNPAGAAITSPLFSLRGSALPEATTTGTNSDNASPDDPGTAAPGSQRPGSDGTGDVRNGGRSGESRGERPGTGRGDDAASVVARSAAGGLVRSATDAQGDMMRVTGTYAQLLEQLERARSRSGQAPGVNGQGDFTTLGASGERNVAVGPGGNSGRGGGAGTGMNSGTAGRGGTVPLGATPGSVTGGGEGYQSTDPTKPNYRPELSGVRPDGVGGLAQATRESLQAGRQVGEMRTLYAPAGSGATAPVFEELLKAGEARMKEGKFMEAADAYQRAVSAEPNNALAVLGRGNAELAAGMYQSAAADLKFVFTKKPELMSVKYAFGGLPLAEAAGVPDG